MDGDQHVVFYYIDPCYAMERHAGKAKFKNKFYFQYEREDSWTRPGVRAFGRVNGGILRKYWECVLQFLGEDKAGLAAKKLEARLKKVLDRRTGQDGQS